MTVKTLTASTISEALADARRQFGDDVVLLESHPPSADRPARIMIMAEPAATMSADGRSISRVIERVKSPEMAAAEASSRGSLLDLVVEDDAEDEDAFSLNIPSYNPPRGRARGRLFPADGAALRSNEEARPEEVTRVLEQLLETRFGTLHERLEGLEKKVEGMPASAGKWLRHPLFNRLLDRGVRAELVTELFFDATSGVDLDDEGLFWALARSLRDRLQACSPVRPYGSQLFIGVGGSGKTSMILRLLTQKNFFGRRRCGVIIATPGMESDRFYQDPTDLYRRAGIPVQNAGTVEEMDQAVARLDGFDHIFVDTPGLPWHPREMRDALAALKPLMECLVPVQTHFVIDATRALEEVDIDILRRMPVSPDIVALTHIDETARPGRVLEWMARAGLPVNFVGSGWKQNEGLSLFSPSAFAEQMLEA